MDRPRKHGAVANAELRELRMSDLRPRSPLGLDEDADFDERLGVAAAQQVHRVLFQLDVASVCENFRVVLHRPHLEGERINSKR